MQIERQSEMRMKAGMEIISSDGRRVGYVGPPPRDGLVQLARFDKTIPVTWIARVDQELILRKTYKEVLDRWGAELGTTVIQGGKRTA
jgi:hypothetical protein